MKFVVSLIIVIAIYPMLIINGQAGTIFNGTNYTNVNYTNIYTNQTYMDIIKSVRDYVYPARDLDFGISISKTCYQMNKYNITSNCPTYESIMLLFPDTSDQKVSGKFIYKDNQLQRAKPQMEKSYRYYDFMENTTILFIDPDTETKKQLGMITIESRLPEYPINYKVIDNTRQMGIGRSIEDCRNAVIGSENWVELLGDTIQFLRNDCHPTFTLYNDNVTIIMKKYEHDITTSNKWLHDKFLEFVKENCLYEYDKC